ncbi:MAG: recombination protein O N-terminal domain-containing protein, partial [Paludibacteraceae bacterium]|nr:recombination protein O N-terminal domain-containing protein [Paludibacteraceae bacterium]
MPTAIVLSLTKYSDTGSIAHLYTAEQGRMQYAVYGNKYKG